MCFKFDPTPKHTATTKKLDLKKQTFDLRRSFYELG
jgi:hypothetical protein